MAPQGNNIVRLTSFSNAETQPAWSYDNQHIAMMRPRPGASNITPAAFS